jgi:hypothetical protein
MKQNTAVDTLCTTVFIFGVLVGTFMHGHISWHDIFAAIFAGILFTIIRITKFRLLIKKVLDKFHKRTNART